jgi:HSP90 family molecular chaperone/class 3 adenylate cyclase
MTTNTTQMESRAININLKTILPSLAKNLYGDDWRITIRELLQNCHDAIAERAFCNPGESEAARIDIIPDPTPGIYTLTFRDNGIGMTLQEVENNLATVGSDHKSAKIEKLAQAGTADRSVLAQIIGQYGIGFLSCFIIADCVEVVTRSQAGASTGVRAVFTGETRWYYSDEPNAAPGTQITLHLKKNEPILDPATGKEIPRQELLNFERLKQEVRRFGDLLPYPIYVHRSPTDFTGDLCNTMKAPWENPAHTRDELLRFLRERHPAENEPISPIAFNFDSNKDKVNAQGVLYFPRTGQEASRSSEPVTQVELFCRRMFITRDIPALLPAWASFVGVVVECPDIVPTLNRNDVIRHGNAFVELKQALGQRIIESLQFLAQERTKDFAEIRGEHCERLYRGLLSDFKSTPAKEEHFFRTIIDYMPFTVIDRTKPAGEAMTLRRYRDESRKRNTHANPNEPTRDQIYYLDASEATGQYKAMIMQRDIPVILASHPAEPGLLHAYGSAFSSEVEVGDVRDILTLYVPPIEQAPYEAMKQFLASLDGGGPDEVSASRFEPSYVPAILIVSSASSPERAEALERLLREGAPVLTGKVRRMMEDEIMGSRTGRATVSAVLNDNNPVVRKIRDHCAEGKPLTGVVADVLHEIYHLARMYSDRAAAESQHFYEHRNTLLARLLETEQQLVAVRSERDLLVLEKRKSSELPTHMEPRTCAMLLTDLRGSTRMVGFLDSLQSAEILQQYAGDVQAIVEKLGGKIEKFTGDGVFAHFALDGATTKEVIEKVSDCALEIQMFTKRFFNRGEVAETLLHAGGIRVEGSRTLLHVARVMYGTVAGAPALVGKQVVALFRACEQDEIFEQSPIVLSEPFLFSLNPLPRPNPIAMDMKLDANLPGMSFYPHPSFARV